jgi:hypothetical protein
LLIRLDTDCNAYGHIEFNWDRDSGSDVDSWERTDGAG